ncbi:UDP-glycosyltransferase UGT5-like [Bacillus rossius redtenbacheri]|uniref:UDP-glycosyltransferase UGT5-like n=1 Tax=Bacillus rossius redtenbacheri TaxID=93214 RepID=UPI002FDD05E5
MMSSGHPSLLLPTFPLATPCETAGTFLVSTSSVSCTGPNGPLPPQSVRLLYPRAGAGQTPPRLPNDRATSIPSPHLHQRRGCDKVARCARILGVFPIPSVSHQVVYRAVMVELARRGHEVVVITPDPIRDPSLKNYTEIDSSFMYEDFRKTFNFAGRRMDDKSPYVISDALTAYGLRLCEMLLDHEPVKKLVSWTNSGEHFDLVFLEWLTTASTYVFAHRFSAPYIGIASLPPFGYNYDSVGNPNNPSYIPDIFMPYSDKMSFFERLDMLAYALWSRHFFYNTMIPRHQALVERHLGRFVPSLLDMHYNVSMLFVNYEPSFHPPRPDVPAIVHLSGLHLKPPKPLPQNIQQFLDSAPKGVIYFSLGSNVRSDKLDASKRQMFLDAFRQLDGYRVLWKWESDHLPGQPDNVMIQKWMPQQDVLRHPKVKAFIMQGGLQSIEEAIHSGVPLIAIPFFSDQDYNTKRIVEKGIGLKLDISEVSKEKIQHALETVLEDNRFRANVRRLSAIMRDQQSSPLERAVWWTEYVLRHGGAAHLRTAAVGMPWYQYLLLDLLAFLLVSAAAAVLLLWRAVRFLYGRLLARQDTKLKNH